MNNFSGWASVTQLLMQFIIILEERHFRFSYITIWIRLPSPFNWTPLLNLNDDDDKNRKGGGLKIQQKKEEQTFTCFWKGLRVDYHSEVEGEQADGMTGNKTKRTHSRSLVKSYLSPEANPLLAGYIWTGFSYLPFDSAQCRCCL